MVAWLVIAICWVIALDGIRRSSAEWLAADRQRSFWILFLIILGPLFVIPYLVGVLPKLVSAGRRGVADPQFMKKEFDG